MLKETVTYTMDQLARFAQLQTLNFVRILVSRANLHFVSDESR